MPLLISVSDCITILVFKVLVRTKHGTGLYTENYGKTTCPITVMAHLLLLYCTCKWESKEFEKFGTHTKSCTTSSIRLAITPIATPKMTRKSVAKTAWISLQKIWICTHRNVLELQYMMF